MNLSRTHLRAVLVLVLALAFSISPLQAQKVCEPFNFCDKDGDGWIKEHRKCNQCVDPAPLGLDCDDNDPGLTDNCSGGGIGFAATLEGIFTFDSVGFTSGPGGEGADSNEGLTLTRPGGDLAGQWDDVFDLCAAWFSGPVAELDVLLGNAKLHRPPGAVSLSFGPSIVEGNIQVGVSLRGTHEDTLGLGAEPQTYRFDNVSLLVKRVSGGSRKRCHQIEPLPTPSCLKINGGKRIGGILVPCSEVP